MLSGTVICVCTYKRPKMLAACVESLIGQGADIIVVDNDPEPHDLPPMPAGVTVVPQPRRGVSAARNAALEAAKQRGYAWLAFTDDDCIAAPDWLAQLKAVQAATGADAVTGPQLYSYPEGTPVSRRQPVFAVRTYAEGVERPFAATNNVLIRLGFVSQHNLAFDEALGFQAGEDTVFFWKFTHAGGKLVWTNKACVTEMVPPERLSLRGHASRSYHIGIHIYRVAIMMGDNWALRRMKRRIRRDLIGGVWRVAVAIPAVLIGRGDEMLFGGIHRVAKASGILAGMFGRESRYYERVTGS
jgi:succinoglycan biosynthesis protein ExoM